MRCICRRSVRESIWKNQIIPKDDKGCERLKYCTKCKMQLRESKVFCPSCGTKQYLPEMNKTFDGTVLLQMRGCRFYKLLLPLECTVTVTDQKISASGSNGKMVYLDAEWKDIDAVSIVRKGLNIKNREGKSFQIDLPAEQADFLPYVQALIEDYRYSAVRVGNNI